MPQPALPAALVGLLARQDGVVSRRQAEDVGLRPHDVARLLRRREWSRVAAGVYVDHTGEPTWRQRCWAAVLSCGPAALYGATALRAAGTPCRELDTETVHLAVDRSRTRPAAPPGVRLHQVTDLDAQTLWNTSPPRQRYEAAVLDLASSATDDLGAVAVLAHACGGRHTTATRLLDALSDRRRVRRRGWLESVLRDVADGTHSVLEHGYLHRVERAHGLPQGDRQRRRDGSRVAYEDVCYGAGAVVELDGLAFHSSVEQREADLARDLEHAADGGATVRLGYRQVFDEACVTTVGVTRFLWARGLDVRPRPCAAGCPVAALTPERTVPRI